MLGDPFFIQGFPGTNIWIQLMIETTAEEGTTHLVTLRDVPENWNEGRCDQLGPVFNPRLQGDPCDGM